MQVVIDWIKRVFWQDPQACFQQMDGVSDLVGCLNVIVWSEALIYLALGAGLFYSILTRFVQVRMFRETFDAEITEDSPYDTTNARIRIDG